MAERGLTGCYIELLPTAGIQAPASGTVGRITHSGKDPHGGTVVHQVTWETGVEMPLPDRDRFRILTGTGGFCYDTLLRHAYSRYAEKWREEHCITDEIIRQSYREWESYISEGICDPMPFSEYLQVFGYAGIREVQVTKKEFEANEFRDADYVKTLLGAMALEAWKKIVEEGINAAKAV